MSHTKSFEKILSDSWYEGFETKTLESVEEIPLQKEVSVCMEGIL